MTLSKNLNMSAIQEESENLDISQFEPPNSRFKVKKHKAFKKETKPVEPDDLKFYKKYQKKPDQPE